MPYQWKPYFNEHELNWKDRFLDLWMNGKKYREHLKNTIELYLEKKPYFHDKARENLAHWQKDFSVSVKKEDLISLTSQDSLVAAREQTRRTGVQHTIVNFANAEDVLGAGRYRVGSQEEAIARQTNLSVTIKDKEIKDDIHYTTAMSKLIKASYLNPDELVMITEADGTPTPANQIFSFKELRSAADDLRVKIFGIPLPFLSYSFNDDSMYNRIKAQLDSLVANNITHVILGAFGCGAFKNPPEKIAQIYRDLLAQDIYSNHFKNIVFAIKGDGKDHNFKAFETIFFPETILDGFTNDSENIKHCEVKDKKFLELHTHIPAAIKAKKDYAHPTQESKQTALQKSCQAKLTSNPWGLFNDSVHNTTDLCHALPNSPNR